MEIVNIGIGSDLFASAKIHAGNRSVFVFPTRIAAGLARQLDMRYWDLADHSYQGMEDFKELLILPETAVLTDEKRLLCLFLVMGEERRESFHILSYGDIVEWGRHFFDFFEELAEECVSAQSLNELKDSGVFHLQAWQETYLEQILQIREDYNNYIGALGFTDRIFYLEVGNICIPWQDYDILFVNQYYYSALDKEIIRALESAGNRVTVIYQGLETDGLKVEGFELKTAWESLIAKPELVIVESADEDSMALAFHAWRQKEAMDSGACAIIDSSFHNKSYSRYFDRQSFKLPSSMPFNECSIYQMLTAISEGINASQQSGGFLPIGLLNKLVSSSWFFPYFFPDNSDSKKEEVFWELARLIDDDYLYVDEQLFTADSLPHLRKLFTEFNGLLSVFARVESIAQLCALIDSPLGLQTSRLVDSEELQHTDIIQVFWERIANFKVIEDMSIVVSWQPVFPETNCGAGILELLLSFLKSARISWNYLEAGKANWEVSNLMDARNRSFEKVAFFQMIEGIVPSNPSPVWLFNETQRSKLGLKNYKDIRAWERYYFYRLLLNCKQAVCFCYRNIERDVSPSSFIGELEELGGDDCGMQLRHLKFSVQIKSLIECRVGSLMKPKLPEVLDAGVCCLENTPPADFFVLPCQPKQDFGAARTLLASASGILQMLKNPFLWYVETNSRLQPRGWEAEETISNKLFGNIMHAYFARILGSESGNHKGLGNLKQIFGDREFLQEELIRLINSDSFRYQIPKNYNADFLTEVISQRLAESLVTFYDNWLKQRLERKDFCLIPETGSMTEAERKHKYLGSVLAGGEEYSIKIRGVSDLRIETASEVMIVDFKTGNQDYRQLIIYEWFYYLLEDVLPPANISSLFWNILDPSKSSTTITADKRDKLKEDILSVFNVCLLQGYYMGRKSSDRLRQRNITRADLFIQEKEGSNA